MLINGQEHGNSHGCVYSIKFSGVVIVVKMVWEDDFFTYNESQVNEILNGSINISSEMKLAIYQFIEKTNSLFFLSYKERN
ncbi:hypothetical protein HAX44_13340 [Enterococcus faecalis]|uniref:hypothetical protein n=1 Tax=Enterococcus faecalis TaxID=1351 RepID=UPI001883DB12|nr:hypothetical protein [Enterococcus faecalis]MBF0006592.1 hypothetical protein [Enterococcus faecalis]MBF0009275.1 hypothetical protein [Enterococcus faecalis]MBF0018456.1 hypothetical protein [Enterococcus faecalis]